MKTVGIYLVIICLLLIPLVFNGFAQTSGDDSITPIWRRQGQEKEVVLPGESIKLFAQGSDNFKLDYAYLSTNETGEWKAHTHLLNWSYAQKITIDPIWGVHAPRNVFYWENFPILFNNKDGFLWDSLLQPVHPRRGFKAHAQPDGDDFLFTDANHEPLNFEIEHYDSDGWLWAWVNVTRLYDYKPTVLYVYYGNPDCDSHENPPGVWDSGYKLVYHMGTRNGTIFDSTRNGLDITGRYGDGTIPTPTMGGLGMRSVRFGIYQDENGNWKGGYMQCDNFTLPANSSYTATIMVDDVEYGYYHPSYFVWSTNKVATAGLSLDKRWPPTSYRWRKWTQRQDGAIFSSSTGWDINNRWQRQFNVLQYNNETKELRYYHDSMTSNIPVLSPIVSTMAVEEGLNFGTSWDQQYHHGQYFAGHISEFRFATCARSPQYILTESNSIRGYQHNTQTEYFYKKISNEIQDAGKKAPGLHDSPQKLMEDDSWQWTNFTWHQPKTASQTRCFGWKITYVDRCGNVVETDVMSFVASGHTPDLVGEGLLEWEEVRPYSKVSDVFWVRNDGMPYSSLNWSVAFYPEWGVWSISPENGSNLRMKEGPVPITVTVRAPAKRNTSFQGEIKLVNTQDPEDYIIIPVRLTTSRFLQDSSDHPSNANDVSEEGNTPLSTLDASYTAMIKGNNRVCDFPAEESSDVALGTGYWKSSIDTTNDGVVLRPQSTVPVVIDSGRQRHHAFARSSCGTHMAAWYDEELDTVVWVYSDDDGNSYSSRYVPLAYGGEDYPVVRYHSNKRFLGTMVPSHSDNNGGVIYVLDIPDATDPESYQLYRHVVYNPDAPEDEPEKIGYFNIKDIDLTTFDSGKPWNWGFITAISSRYSRDVYGKIIEIERAGTLFYPLEDGSLGHIRIGGYYHISSTVDPVTKYAYTAHHVVPVRNLPCFWDNGQNGFHHVKLYRYNMSKWQEGEKGQTIIFGTHKWVKDYDWWKLFGWFDQTYDNTNRDGWYHPEYDITNPALEVYDDNIVLLVEAHNPESTDLICYHGPPGNWTHPKFQQCVIAQSSTDNEFLADVAHLYAQTFVCTFFIGDNLYSSMTFDAGGNWSKPRLIDTWTYESQLEYPWIYRKEKSATISDDGVMVMYERNVGDNDVDIWVDRGFHMSECKSDLTCSGELTWRLISPGSNISSNFTISNKGEPQSSLNWQIVSWPTWGSWKFTPGYGENLTPEKDPDLVYAEVKAPEMPFEKFSGKIVVINSENPIDKCEIPVLLTTGKKTSSLLKNIIPEHIVPSSFCYNLHSSIRKQLQKFVQ